MDAEKNQHNNWKRQDIAQLLSQYEQLILECPGRSENQIAEILGVPRSTLQHWIERKNSINADPAMVAFFESPVGAAILHRLILGAHFVMTLIGSCSVRHVCEFMELTGLDQFVAATYSPQYNVTVKMEEAVSAFTREEVSRLATDMSPRQITVCQDETFQPQPCLVTIEPVSNFILLEKNAEGRSSQDWTDATREALAGLPVEIIQSVSDEGAGILHHVKTELGAHHSPDVFHVQQEIVRGPGVALAGKTRRAAGTLERASGGLNRCIEARDACLSRHPDSSRLPELERRIEAAQKAEDDARQTFESASVRQASVQNAVTGISRAYHPVNLETGVINSAEEVEASLKACFSEIEAAASESGLSERCTLKIKKSKNVVPAMLATIVFFLLNLRIRLESLSLAPEIEQVMLNNLIPAAYIRRVAEHSRCSDRKAELYRKAEDLLAPLQGPDDPLMGLSAAERAQLENAARDCADVFQRSSSCVEGRNGQLSLRHHSFHRLNDRKLSALTGIHNFWLKRPDGTTAAERFFGAKIRDMFEYILDHVDLPGWPAGKRTKCF